MTTVRDKWLFELESVTGGEPTKASIPGRWIHDNESDDNFRFVASAYGWRKLRAVKCEAANNRCVRCGSNTSCPWGELHHTGQHGRGMGGSWKDDRYTEWLCKPCHRAEEEKRTGVRWRSATGVLVRRDV